MKHIVVLVAVLVVMASVPVFAQQQLGGGEPGAPSICVQPPPKAQSITVQKDLLQKNFVLEEKKKADDKKAADDYYRNQVIIYDTYKGKLWE
jgi:hypothetical protein